MKIKGTLFFESLPRNHHPPGEFVLRTYPFNMASIAKRIGGKAADSLMQKHLNRITPRDPVWEEYTDSKGRIRRRKREIPPGLSKRDQKILRKVNRRAHRMDKGMHIAGFRFGYTALLGLVPVVGDVADLSLSYCLIIRKAKQADIPPWLVRKMMSNSAVATGMGFVPIAGDIAVAAFKPNSRNALLLAEFLEIRGDEFLRAQATKDAAIADAVKPGVGVKEGEKIPGGSRGWFGRRKKSAVMDPASAEEMLTVKVKKERGRAK